MECSDEQCLIDDLGPYIRPEDWELLSFFRPHMTTDQWGDPYRMRRRLVFALEALRVTVARPIHVHSGYRDSGDKSWHNSGAACDFHIHNMNLLDQFISVSRFNVFTGIGVYSWWKNPGIHVDIRPIIGSRNRCAFWWSPADGTYHQLTHRAFAESFAEKI